MTDLLKLISVAQRSALTHVSRPPRLLFTSARVHKASARAYYSSLERLNGSLPIEANVVDPNFAAHSGGVISEDDFAQLFETAAYSIPEGKTYLIKHLRNGVFAIVGENGNNLRGCIDKADCTK